MIDPTYVMMQGPLKKPLLVRCAISQINLQAQPRRLQQQP